jgi:hypothetical protein
MTKKVTKQRRKALRRVLAAMRRRKRPGKGVASNGG